MRKNKEEIINDEVVEEVKEETSVNEEEKIETVEEVKEEPVVVETTVEEPEDEGITRDFKISFETFKEFYNQGGIKGLVKQCGIFCVIMALVIYFTSDRSDIGAMFARMGIYCGVIIVVTIANYFITNKLMLPRQYKRQGLDNLVINVKINNKGIVQTIGERNANVPWANIVMAIETDISYIFYSNNRSGFIFTKDEQMTLEEKTYISEMIKAKVPNYKRQESKVK